MLFNSVEYIIFLPSVFLLYWMINADVKKQNVLLLVSSYIFYGWWDWRFLSLIIFSSFVDYFIGLKLYSSQDMKVRNNWLLLSLFSNLGLLATFKYFNFFSTSFRDLMLTFGWEVDTITLNLILPVGISFYTFQTLSYTIDIYRNNIKPTNSVISFFTYVSFFPQLVAGPIERAAHLLPQIETKRAFNYTLFKAGVFQIFIGLLRKVAIADNLGIYVDSVYSNIEIYNSSTLLLATVFYAFQIYFDFAGYSDIAIGSAKLLGFKFEQNFNLPYFSKSLTEFWRKWHISLSSWLRDYLYISLGGNRRGIKITYRNLMITMLLGGLWHGSSFNFIIWGGIHGVTLSCEKFIFANTKYRSFGSLGFLYTFLIVLISWSFFRAQDLSSAMNLLAIIFHFNFAPPFLGDINIFVNAVLLLLVGLVVDYFLFKKNISLEKIGETFNTIQLSLIASLIILVLCLFYSTSENFIYFQF